MNLQSALFLLTILTFSLPSQAQSEHQCEESLYAYQDMFSTLVADQSVSFGASEKTQSVNVRIREAGMIVEFDLQLADAFVIKKNPCGSTLMFADQSIVSLCSFAALGDLMPFVKRDKNTHVTKSGELVLNECDRRISQLYALAAGQDVFPGVSMCISNPNGDWHGGASIASASDPKSSFVLDVFPVFISTDDMSTSFPCVLPGEVRLRKTRNGTPSLGAILHSHERKLREILN